MKRLLFGFLGVVLVASVALAIRYTPYDPPAWTAEQVLRRVDLLNDIASQTPHTSLVTDPIRKQNANLFEKVERGRELTDEESIQYRLIYQEILKQNQRRLQFFDWNLTVLSDFGMSRANNVGGHGIGGGHDHHDASAQSNFMDVEAQLERIRQASGPFAPIMKILNMAGAYKDLSDILFHLATAPETKSVTYERSRATGPLAEVFEDLLLNFKQAQFEPVNSTGYIASIHRALDSYDKLVLAVQAMEYANLNTIERTLAGRWGSWQSLMPPIDENSKPRFPRSTTQAAN